MTQYPSSVLKYLPQQRTYSNRFTNIDKKSFENIQATYPSELKETKEPGTLSEQNPYGSIELDNPTQEDPKKEEEESEQYEDDFEEEKELIIKM